MKNTTFITILFLAVVIGMIFVLSPDVFKAEDKENGASTENEETVAVDQQDLAADQSAEMIPLSTRESSTQECKEDEIAEREEIRGSTTEEDLAEEDYASEAGENGDLLDPSSNDETGETANKESLLCILSESLVSNDGCQYNSYLGKQESDYINVFANDVCGIALSNAASYNLWTGGFSQSAFSLLNVKEAFPGSTSLSFSAGLATGAKESMDIKIYFADDTPVFEGTLDAAQPPINITLDISNADVMRITLQNHAGQFNTCVLYDFDCMKGV